MQLATWLRTLASAFARRPRPKPTRRRRTGIRRLHLEALEDRVVPSTVPDTLYIGSNADNGHSANDSVQSFNASTGASLGTFVSGSDSLKGVRGLIFDSAGHLLVANQDVFRGKPGEIMKYNANSGAFEGELVPFQDPNAPFAPRGIVLKNNVLYVANLQNANTTQAGIAPDGEIDKYDATTGRFLGHYSRPAGWVGQFNPRAVAFGPDGKLYASVFDSSNLARGYVVKIDVSTGAESIFASTATTAPDMHRPEGLTFGPDGKLYVTGYRANTSDTDKILALDPTTGAEVKSIATDAVGQSRAYGQGILFGPGGRLFVPISTLDSPYSGAVRSYNVSDGSFVNFEAPGTLGSGWYLTFRNTDPATLAYVDPAPASSAAALASPAITAAIATLAAAQPAPTSVLGTTASTSPPTAVAVSAPTTSAAVSATGATPGPAAPAGAVTVWGENDLSGDVLADPLTTVLTR